MAKTIIIGGGFYGACLALYSRSLGQEVLLLEQGETLLSRASLINQARIHFGYHYPRSFVTAARSAINFPRFIVDFRDAVVDGFSKIYAIPTQGSKISGQQFYTFCRKVGAPIREAPAVQKALFNPDLIDSVFSVREFAFDAVKLRRILEDRLRSAGVIIRFKCPVDHVSHSAESGLCVHLAGGSIDQTDHILIAAYSRINTLLRASSLPPLPMKHEVAEIALVRHTPPLDGMGVTVMDGAFFSTMPFPSRNAHSFTHVRYTPHGSWNDIKEPFDPDAVLAGRHHQTTYPLMVKDAARYLPSVAQTKYLDSLFEVKTVLLQNEGNDGRPILFRRDHGAIPGLSIVMGGKIDNIYDIYAAMGNEGSVKLNIDEMSAILQGRMI